MYVIVTNHVNWHRENLQLDRENTGNLKIHFEWVPCLFMTHSPCLTVSRECHPDLLVHGKAHPAGLHQDGAGSAGHLRVRVHGHRVLRVPDLRGQGQRGHPPLVQTHPGGASRRDPDRCQDVHHLPHTPLCRQVRLDCIVLN